MAAYIAIGVLVVLVGGFSARQARRRARAERASVGGYARALDVLAASRSRAEGVLDEGADATPNVASRLESTGAGASGAPSASDAAAGTVRGASSAGAPGRAGGWQPGRVRSGVAGRVAQATPFAVPVAPPLPDPVLHFDDLVGDDGAGAGVAAREGASGLEMRDGGVLAGAEPGGGTGGPAVRRVEPGVLPLPAARGGEASAGDPPTLQIPVFREVAFEAADGAAGATVTGPPVAGSPVVGATVDDVTVAGDGAGPHRAPVPRDGGGATPPAARPPSGRRRPVALLGGALVVAVVALVALALVPLRRSPTAERSSGPSSTAASSSPSSTAPTTRPTSTTPTTSSSPTTSTTASGSASGLRPTSEVNGLVRYVVPSSSYSVSLFATNEPCWVEALTAPGGSQVYVGVVEPGQTQVLPSTAGQLWFRAGNPATLQISVDGEPVRYASQNAQPLNFSFVAASSASSGSTSSGSAGSGPGSTTAAGPGSGSGSSGGGAPGPGSGAPPVTASGSPVTAPVPPSQASSG